MAAIKTAAVVALPDSPVSQKEGPSVKTVHFYKGPDLIGTKSSCSHKNTDIYELKHGLLLVSKKEKRKVVVPFNNIVAYELL